MTITTLLHWPLLAAICSFLLFPSVVLAAAALLLGLLAAPLVRRTGRSASRRAAFA